jgi:alkylhydroperoxidase family enzyme
MPRLKPLSKQELDARGVDLSFLGKDFHELPNSVPTLAYRPDILKATGALWQAIMGEGAVDRGLKWLVGYLASMSAGCRYCSAHTATGANTTGVSAEKIEAIWEYETSPLYSEAERAALRVAQGAGHVPNAVSDEDFDAMKRYYSAEQIAEIVSVIAIYGFFNRWNDTMATALEQTPRAFAEGHLKGHGWEIGKHE